MGTVFLAASACFSVCVCVCVCVCGLSGSSPCAARFCSLVNHARLTRTLSFCLKPQLFDGVFTCLTQAGAKAKKDASWDTWFGPMAINLRQLMHVNLLYNSSAQPNTAVVAE